MKRGEIRWYTFALPDKRRPVLILTRDEVIDYLNEIIVVPVTRTIRGLVTEVVLTPDDGMPVVWFSTLITLHSHSDSVLDLCCVVCRRNDGLRCNAR